MKTTQTTVRPPKNSKANNSQSPKPMINKDHLLFGDSKLPISNGSVEVPSGILDDMEISQLPKKLQLDFDRISTNVYPMDVFSMISLLWSGKKLVVELTAIHDLKSDQDYSDATEWDAIMNAATIIASGERNWITKSFRMGDFVYHITKIPAKGVTVDEMYRNALSSICRIEKYARAFHFAHAHENMLFEPEEVRIYLQNIG